MKYIPWLLLSVFIFTRPVCAMETKIDEKQLQASLLEAISQGDTVKLFDILLEPEKIKIDEALIAALEYQVVNKDTSEDMVRALIKPLFYEKEKKPFLIKTQHGLPALHVILTFEKPSVNNFALLLGVGADKHEKAPSNEALDKDLRLKGIQGKTPLEFIEAKLKALEEEKKALAQAVKPGFWAAFFDLIKDAKVATVGGEKSIRKKLHECNEKIAIFMAIQKLLSFEEKKEVKVPEIGIAQLIAALQQYQKVSQQLLEALQALGKATKDGKESKDIDSGPKPGAEPKDEPKKEGSGKIEHLKKAKIGTKRARPKTEFKKPTHAPAPAEAPKTEEASSGAEDTKKEGPKVEGLGKDIKAKQPMGSIAAAAAAKAKAKKENPKKAS